MSLISAWKWKWVRMYEPAFSLFYILESKPEGHLAKFREWGLLHPPSPWATSSPAEAVRTSLGSQSTLASSLSCLSLHYERSSRGCITKLTSVSSVQHCHIGAVCVSVSPWAVLSCTWHAFEPLCGWVERGFARRGDSGPALILLVLLWGRGHCLDIEIENFLLFKLHMSKGYSSYCTSIKLEDS